MRNHSHSKVFKRAAVAGDTFFFDASGIADWYRTIEVHFPETEIEILVEVSSQVRVTGEDVQESRFFDLDVFDTDGQFAIWAFDSPPWNIVRFTMLEDWPLAAPLTAFALCCFTGKDSDV